MASTGRYRQRGLTAAPQRCVARELWQLGAVDEADRWPSVELSWRAGRCPLGRPDSYEF
jgi:hypothetical protein